jgi:hypothetical protein
LTSISSEAIQKHTFLNGRLPKRGVSGAFWVLSVISKRKMIEEEKNVPQKHLIRRNLGVFSGAPCFF